MIENNYRTITETTYQKIRELIIEGEYESNSRLLLNNLANEMRVSITPIREAFKKLEKDGLVRIIPNKGAVVTKLTIKDVNEIYDIRGQLESLAVELLIKKDDKSFLDGLNKVLIEDENCLRKDNLRLHAKYNNKFHKLLINYSENKRLSKFYDELSGQLSMLVSKTISFAGEPKKSSDEHRKIVEAIKQNDEKLAKRIIQNHIQNAKRDILKRSNGMSKEKRLNDDIEIDEII